MGGKLHATTASFHRGRVLQSHGSRFPRFPVEQSLRSRLRSSDNEAPAKSVRKALKVVLLAHSVQRTPVPHRHPSRPATIMPPVLRRNLMPPWRRPWWRPASGWGEITRTRWLIGAAGPLKTSTLWLKRLGLTLGTDTARKRTGQTMLIIVPRCEPQVTSNS